MGGLLCLALVLLLIYSSTHSKTYMNYRYTRTERKFVTQELVVQTVIKFKYRTMRTRRVWGDYLTIEDLWTIVFTTNGFCQRAGLKYLPEDQYQKLVKIYQDEVKWISNHNTDNPEKAFKELLREVLYTEWLSQNQLEVILNYHNLTLAEVQS